MSRLTARANLCAAISVSIFLFWVTVLCGQTPTGSISGLVKDESGAVVPGATVVITNVETGVKRSVPSDAGGRYRVPGLDPGSYRVEAQAAGFQTVVRQGIQLTVGREIEIEMLLRLGQVEQVTEVTAEAPLVETVTNTLSGLVDEQTIRELPLNGRSFDQLIALQPGVHEFRNQNHRAVAGTAGSYFSVGGSRPMSNQFLLDGIELVGAGQGSILPGGVLGKNMGVDAIQEFNVLTANYSAAYGKRYGGIVNIATRAGTNQLHGSAFEFLRNDNLDARNFFDPKPQPPEFKRNQFGGSLGGPLRKDRTFFFGNYEGLREGLGETDIAVVPDNNARQGLLPDPRNPGQLIDVGVHLAVRPLIPAFFGPPNGRNFGDGTAEHIGSPANVARQDFFLVRMDHHFSEKDSLFARYNFNDATSQDPRDDSLFIDGGKSRQQSLTLEVRRVYPTTLNIARFGFSRGVTAVGRFPITPIDASLRFIPSAKDVGFLSFGGGVSTSGAQALTPTGISGSDRSYVLNQFEYSDQVFYYHGRHSLQFGATVQRIQHNDINASNENGQFGFASLESFLRGQPSAFVAAAGDVNKSFRRIYFAGFAQDDFKILPNLTLNLGLRYELMTVPVEVRNRLSNFHRQFVNGIWVLETTPHVGSPLWKGSHDLWAPRVGFAWDPFNDSRTAVRGGFGIFYDQVVGQEFRHPLVVNPPFYAEFTVDNPPFPSGLSGVTGQAPKPNPTGVDVDFGVPTKLQWNFGIERQLTGNAALGIAYLGSHEYHLTSDTDPNTGVPEILPGGIKFYPAGAPRRNPAFGPGEFMSTNASGFYESLQVDYTQRLSQGLRTKISYTYSKNIDEASGIGSGDATGNPNMPQDPDNLRAQRGLSSFDTRHSLAMNFTYDLPGSNLSGLPGKLMGGWQLGSIVAASSGEPITPQVGFRRSRNQIRNNADRPNLRPGASNNPVLGGPDRYYDPNAFELPPAGFYGNLGRNTVIGPSFANLDFSLVKITPVGERLRTEFRAEFFNLFNHANFGLPDPAVFNSNGTVRGAAGRISSTANTSRQIQFGLKLSF